MLVPTSTIAIGHPLASGMRRGSDVGDDEQVRRGPEAVVWWQRLRVGDIERSAGELAGVERVRERGGVDDRPPCGVDKDRGRLHPGERLAVDQVVRSEGQRAVDRDEVGLAQEAVELGAAG